MILTPGIRELPSGVRICGYDAFYGFGSLEPATIGEHTITSLFWRDGWAQVVVAGVAPEELFEKITISFMDKDFVLKRNERKDFGPTVHGDTCWVWAAANPGASGGSFPVVIV